MDGEAHVPVGRALADELIRAKLVRRFPCSRDLVVVDTDGAAHATWVFGLLGAR
ncbi:MAG: hypothetical protein ABIY55_19830 [Kofleriaceae bacterium]